MKALWLLRPLLRMNRWLLLLLLLWPLVMAAMLLMDGLHPASEDVLSVLRQECLYGIALVGFNGAALLGNEQRSRRIVTALSRAVSRSTYLLALFLAAWVPLVLYGIGFAASACLLVRLAGARVDVVWKLALLQLVVGVWVACLSLCFSVFLPSMLASLAAVGTAFVLEYLKIPGPGRLITGMFQMPLESVALRNFVDIPVTLVASAAVFAIACVAFAGRDLNLTID